jgi:SAM-dependent methyltransferase
MSRNTIHLSQAQIRERILSEGTFPEHVKRKIYEKWFKRPRKSFLAALRHFALHEKILCDVGCGYGSNLLYCSPDSYGIEITESAVDFARSIGLTVYHRDIFSDLSDLPRAEVIWCADVLEHVETPHGFLRKLAQLLQKDGLLFIKVPAIPLYRLPLPVLKRYQTGYSASDHINGFTCATLRFLCERSGFKTISAGPFISPVLRILNHIPLLAENLGQAVYIGSKIDNWQYPQRATRLATNDGKGFVYKDKFGVGKYLKEEYTKYRRTL